MIGLGSEKGWRLERAGEKTAPLKAKPGGGSVPLSLGGLEVELDIIE